MAQLTALLVTCGALAAAGCSSDVGCQLNGVCVAGACRCDAAWKGPSCSAMNLLPTSATGDLRMPNVSTWGMTVIPPRAGGADTDTEWHGFYAEMTRGCGLTSWESNSQVSHAVAPSPDGPWTRRGTALGVWAHTPSAAVAKDGTIVLFHLGSGASPGTAGPALPGSREYNARCEAGRSPCGTHPQHHCNMSISSASSPAAAASSSPRAAAVSPSSPASSVPTTVSFHVATDPAGPWREVTAAVTDSYGVAARANADNFAFDTPFTHPNGSIFVITASRAILRADDWRGPYDVVAVDACGGGEDDYLYVDHRGHFHCLYHRSPFQNLTAQGGHAFSTDGHTWHVSETPAYPAKQAYADGSVRHYGKRERPHLVFDPGTGQPTHLTNGVCLNGNWALCNDNPYPGYFDYTFTTVAPLGTPKPE